MEARTNAKWASWPRGAVQAAQALLLGLSSLLVACGGGTALDDAPADTVVRTTPAAPTRVQLPVEGWSGEEARLVIHNPDEWASAWARHSAVWPTPAVPALDQIDFQQHRLVGVTTSYGGCGGGVRITSATLDILADGTAWVVQFQASDLGAKPGLVCTTDIKPVADFILLPQSAQPVVFVELPRLR